ncbi:hypothetical protein EXE44_13240 [Halorubrum sp. SS7]|nr:hypothetical protein EXE44_13240 [Halorubrum sp. SS7]
MAPASAAVVAARDRDGVGTRSGASAPTAAAATYASAGSAATNSALTTNGHGSSARSPATPRT